MDTAVFYVEQTARYGRLDMSSHARKINLFQLALLDVIGFIVGVVSAIIASIVFLWKMCNVRRKEKTS